MSYGIYIAQVVESAVDGDDRLRVRVLPQMQNTETLPDKNCPKWPFFFRDEFYTGTQTVLGNQVSNDYVWVICNDDFSVGYILGVANYTTYSNDTTLYKQKSIPIDLKDIIKKSIATIKGEEFAFKNLKVTFWNKDSVHLIEESTGGKIIAFRNGTFYVMRPAEFVVSIGDTKFTMNSTGVSFTGASIKLESKDVTLGKGELSSVLVTAGKTGAHAKASEFVKA